MFLRFYLVFGNVVNQLGYNLYNFGQIFIVTSGQILKNHSGHLVTLLGRPHRGGGEDLRLLLLQFRQLQQ